MDPDHDTGSATRLSSSGCQAGMIHDHSIPTQPTVTRKPPAISWIPQADLFRRCRRAAWNATGTTPDLRWFIIHGPTG